MVNSYNSGLEIFFTKMFHKHFETFITLDVH